MGQPLDEALHGVDSEEIAVRVLLASLPIPVSDITLPEECRELNLARIGAHLQG
jgi:hypothetical protein